MYFAGHIAVAFVITYLLAKRFPDIRRSASIALVMLLSILPDIDLALRAAGINFGHRSLTHSVLIVLFVGGLAILFLMKGRIVVALYVAAYLSHIVIGDIIVAEVNVAYPFGERSIGSGIESGSLTHIGVEFVLLGIMFAIVFRAYHLYPRNTQSGPPYQNTLDRYLFPVLMSALVVSYFYVAYELQLSGKIFNWTPLLVLFIHLAAVYIVMMIWLMSKATDKNVETHEKQNIN